MARSSRASPPARRRATSMPRRRRGRTRSSYRCGSTSIIARTRPANSSTAALSISPTRSATRFDPPPRRKSGSLFPVLQQRAALVTTHRRKRSHAEYRQSAKSRSARASPAAASCSSARPALAGMMLPDLLRLEASGGRHWPIRTHPQLHHDLPRRLAGPARYLGHEAERPGRGARQVPADRDQRAAASRSASIFR